MKLYCVPTVSYTHLDVYKRQVNNGTVVSKSGNSMKVKADDGKTAVVTLTQNNLSDSGEFTGFLTLTSNSKQTLAKLKAGKRKYYVAVKDVYKRQVCVLDFSFSASFAP